MHRTHHVVVKMNVELAKKMFFKELAKVYSLFVVIAFKCVCVFFKGDSGRGVNLLFPLCPSLEVQLSNRLVLQASLISCCRSL